MLVLCVTGWIKTLIFSVKFAFVFGRRNICLHNCPTGAYLYEDLIVSNGPYVGRLCLRQSQPLVSKILFTFSTLNQAAKNKEQDLKLYDI